MTNSIHEESPVRHGRTQRLLRIFSTSGQLKRNSALKSFTIENNHRSASAAHTPGKTRKIFALPSFYLSPQHSSVGRDHNAVSME
jgi:hypothetical protein